MLACGADPAAYRVELEGLGFELHAPHKRTLRPADDHAALIARCPGRVYTNLVGLKGRFVSPATA